MGRKCSVAKCRSNYDSNEKVTVYGFPLKDPKELESWLSSLPNIIKQESVTRNMGVCRLHWPSDTSMKSVNGKLRPDSPPTIFPGCPDSFKRQTCQTKLRDIQSRRVSSAARSTKKDELDDFEISDKIPKDFKIFIESVRQRISVTDCSYRDFHVIETDNGCELLQLQNFSSVVVRISISSDFSVIAYHKNTKVSSIRCLLGYQCKLERFSQLENIISRSKHYPLDLYQETEHHVNRLKESFELLDFQDADFLLEQLQLKVIPPNGRRYSAKTMVNAVYLFLKNRSAYESLRQFLALPSANTILQHVGPVNSIGSEHVAKQLADLCFDSNESPLCILIFDEIHLKPSLRYRGGHVLGYSFDRPKELARTMLAYMIKLVFRSQQKSFLIRLVPVHTLTAELLYDQTMNLLQIIHSAGGKVLSLLSDNLSANRKMHNHFRRNFTSGFSFKVVHPFQPSSYLYLLFDTVHIYKSLRNNWFTEKDQQIQFFPPGGVEFVTAKWDDLVELYLSECENPIKRTILTAQSINPSNFDRQKVSFACQIFNDKTVAALSQDGKFETACFVYHVCRLWKVLNNKSITAHTHLNDVDRAPVDCSNSLPLKILRGMSTALKRMNVSGRKRKNSLTAETKESTLQTIDGLVDLSEYLLKEIKVKFVLLGEFQSDCLEGEFGNIRGMFGGMYYIAVEQVLMASKIRQLKIFKGLDVNMASLESFPSHYQHCCESELTDCEIKLTDEALQGVAELSAHEKSVIFYVSGYVTMKEGLPSDESRPYEEKQECEFTRLVSRGKLKYPSRETYNFALISYSFFKKADMRCKKRVAKCLRIIHDCYFSFENCHRIISRFTNVFFCGFVKSKTDFKNVNNVRKMRKLS